MANNASAASKTFWIFDAYIDGCTETFTFSSKQDAFRICRRFEYHEDPAPRRARSAATIAFYEDQVKLSAESILRAKMKKKEDFLERLKFYNDLDLLTAKYNEDQIVEHGFDDDDIRTIAIFPPDEDDSTSDMVIQDPEFDEETGEWFARAKDTYYKYIVHIVDDELEFTLDFGK